MDIKNPTAPWCDRLSNKPFLTWLLTTPPHLKYVSTLVSRLFSDINMSQRSESTIKLNTQGVMGFLISTLLQIYQGIFQ